MVDIDHALILDALSLQAALSVPGTVCASDVSHLLDNLLLVVLVLVD